MFRLFLFDGNLCGKAAQFVTVLPDQSEIAEILNAAACNGRCVARTCHGISVGQIIGQEAAVEAVTRTRCVYHMHKPTDADAYLPSLIQLTYEAALCGLLDDQQPHACFPHTLNLKVKLPGNIRIYFIQLDLGRHKNIRKA